MEEKEAEGTLLCPANGFSTLCSLALTHHKAVHATSRFRHIARTKVCLLLTSGAKRCPTSKVATHTLAAKKDKNSKIQEKCCSKQNGVRRNGRYAAPFLTRFGQKCTEKSRPRAARLCRVAGASGGGI